MGEPASTILDEESCPARRVRRRYLVGLGLVALLVLAGTYTMELLAAALQADPQAVNLAGRQRMLGERVTMEAVQIRERKSSEATRSCLAELERALTAWSEGHDRVRREVENPVSGFSDPEIHAAAARVESAYRPMAEAARELLAAADASTAGGWDAKAVERFVDRILRHEPLYLAEMDRLVSFYERKASSHVTSLERAAIVLPVISLLMLALVGLLVFEPAVRLIRRQFLDLRALLEESHRAKREMAARNTFIQSAFGRYLSDEVVHQLLETPDGLELRGEEREVTLLMSDLRGFTALTASLPPRTAVRLLNHYLESMTTVITDHGGTIDEVVGDSILAIFGAPLSDGDHARHAASCALSMQLELERLNEALQKEGLPKLRAGIAVHTGAVIAGNVGSAKRAKYGVVGPTVNSASRLQDRALPGQVLVSEATLEAIGDESELGRGFEIEMKGLEQPVRAYELTGLKGARPIDYPRKEEPMVSLREGFPIGYRTIVEKQVGRAMFRGVISRISSEQAEIQPVVAESCPACSSEFAAPRRVLAVGVQDEIELSLTSTEGRILASTVYARVTETAAGEIPGFRVLFTGVPPTSQAIIHGLIQRNAASVEAGPAAPRGRSLRSIDGSRP